MTIRDFDESTLDAAKMVVRKRFGEGSCELLVRYLRNPLRRMLDHPVGDIVYRDEKPMAFQAANLRRLYLRQEEIMGINGSLLCKMPEAKLKEVLTVFYKTIEPRAGRKIYFGNTAIPVSGDIGTASGMSIGPESCENVRFAIIRLGSFLNFMVKGYLPKILVTIIDAIWMCGTRLLGKSKADRFIKKIELLDELDVDDFWHRYLLKNNGLVSSRAKEELEWIFGDNLRCGKVLFLSYVRDGVAEGYVTVKRQGDERNGRWMIVDWIAVGDDAVVLKELLIGVCAYLRRIKKASFVEIIGYPMFVQKVIRSVFRFRRKAPGNSFNYLIDDETFRKRFEQVKDVSWFFGAYDGDRCM